MAPKAESSIYSIRIQDVFFMCVCVFRKIVARAQKRTVIGSSYPALSKVTEPT